MSSNSYTLDNKIEIVVELSNTKKLTSTDILIDYWYLIKVDHHPINMRSFKYSLKDIQNKYGISNLTTIISRESKVYIHDLAHQCKYCNNNILYEAKSRSRKDFSSQINNQLDATSYFFVDTCQDCKEQVDYQEKEFRQLILSLVDYRYKQTDPIQYQHQLSFLKENSLFNFLTYERKRRLKFLITEYPVNDLYINCRWFLYNKSEHLFRTITNMRQNHPKNRDFDKDFSFFKNNDYPFFELGLLSFNVRFTHTLPLFDFAQLLESKQSLDISLNYPDNLDSLIPEWNDISVENMSSFSNNDIK